MSKPSIRVVERFLDKLHLTNDCWTWRGHREKGYGRFYADGKMWQAHRYGFLMAHGGVGQELDHICRNRACVRPSHLREVTRRENVMAPGSLSPTKTNAEKEQCIRGHALTPENISKFGSRRRCKACKREWQNANRTEATRARDRAYRAKPGVAREKRLEYLREYSKARRATCR